MHKKTIALVLATMLPSVSLSALAVDLFNDQKTNDWYKQGEQVLANKLAQTTQNKAKNVILFVGDGMGISTLTAARILQGQQAGKSGEEGYLSFEKFPFSALVKTYNVDAQTPDSAGTMTAMISGLKSDAGVIGVNENIERGNCATVKGNEVATLLELAEIRGLSTGIISTARITHATPAATYAKSAERNWEDISDMPSEAVDQGCEDIASQLINFEKNLEQRYPGVDVDGIEVMFGGGRRHFLPKDIAFNSTDAMSEVEGDRTDEVDLTAQWQTNYPQGKYIIDQTGFDSLDTTNTPQVLGLFNESHMQYEADRANDIAGEPSLTEMTTTALDILNNNNKGYFLTVESGRIDHGHHAGSAYNALTDTIELANAVQAAIDNTNPEETLILVTADHSHVFTIAGYPKRGNPILGKVVSVGSTEATLASDGMPYTTVGYTNGLGHRNLIGATDADKGYNEAINTGRINLTAINTMDSGYHQEANIPLGSETHAGEDISVHAMGPGAQLVQGNIEQSVIFHIINKALGLTEQLPKLIIQEKCMKNFNNSIIALTILCSLAACDDSDKNNTLTRESLSTNVSNEWFIQGEKAIETAETNWQSVSEISELKGKAKNVILFVGDGMGISTLTAARILEGQRKGMLGESNRLSFENFPFSGFAKTYNVDAQTPDSAGTMTAMMSGVKTDAGVLGVDADIQRGNCTSVVGNEMTTALELAEIAGKSTGIISTARITHATPAATYAKSAERNWEDVSDMSADAIAAGCEDIASQLVNFEANLEARMTGVDVDGIEVVMGGGRRHFLPKDAAFNSIDASSEKEGDRNDGRDLTAEWRAKYTSGKYIVDQAGFDAINPETTTRLFGLFNESHMQYEADRANDIAGEPSLSEMTSKAIDILNNNDKGFFLTVESGRIDHAHHAGNAYNALNDTIELAKAVQMAMDNTNPEETLIIVTADHSHVFTIAGYPKRGNPILGKVVGVGQTEESLASDGMPYTTLGYTNGLGYQNLGQETDADAAYANENGAGRVDLTSVDTTTVGFHQEALVPLSSETHAGEDVAIFASGPGAHLVTGTNEQSIIFHIMNYAANLTGSND